METPLRAFAVLVFALAWASAAPAQVPNPTVIGPIAVGASPGDPSHEYTFFTDDLIDAFNYVEEEYFLEGTANVYSTPPQTTGAVVSSDHPYRSRMVVRRPANPRHFNGVVIVEWQNVTAGYDIDASWVGGGAAHMMREGYVWVGVSAQRVGIHQPGTGLRAWSPARYGSLDVTVGGTILNDALSYDIFSQAGQALAHPDGVDPLAGLEPQVLIASGASQSASRLTTYYNSIQPLAQLFDAYYLAVGGGLIRGDLRIPVFKLQSETEATSAAIGFGTPVQPDTDVHRTWQVAGSAHADGFYLDAIRIRADRDNIPRNPEGICNLPEGSRVHLAHVGNAATDHLAEWAASGTPPPTAALIETVAPMPPTTIARDDLGLALGGIRIADVEVPTALNLGTNGGPSFCFLFGASQPFDAATLDALYRNHGEYVRRVKRTVRDNQRAGYITTFDAQATTREAAQSKFGK